MCYDCDHQNLWLFTWHSIQSVRHYHAKCYQPHPTPPKPHPHIMCCIFHTKMPSRKHNTGCVFPTASIHWPPPRQALHPPMHRWAPSFIKQHTQKDSSGRSSCLYVCVCRAVCALCSKLPNCFQIRPSWRQRPCLLSQILPLFAHST